MKQKKKLKVIYEYTEPKTSEEKIEQQKRLELLFSYIFEEIQSKYIKK